MIQEVHIVALRQVEQLLLQGRQEIPSKWYPTTQELQAVKLSHVVQGGEQREQVVPELKYPS